MNCPCNPFGFKRRLLLLAEEVLEALWVAG